MRPPQSSDSSRSIRPSSRSRSGRTGDNHLRVLGSLKHLSSEHYTVYSDIYLPRPGQDGATHLDHVVVSCQGIFVIQLEQGGGDVSCRSNGSQRIRFLCEKAVPLPGALMRNEYHITALAHFLRQPEAIFRSIVFYTGEVVFTQHPPPNVLTSGLGRYITSQPVEPRLTPALLAQINSDLETASRTMDRDTARRSYHASLRRRKSSHSNDY